METKRVNQTRGECKRWVVQGLYAKILSAGTRAGLSILVLGFVLYVSGVLGPAVPTEQVADYWHLPACRYQQAINEQFLHLDAPATGWRWLKLVSRGDYLSLLGIAALAGTSILCFLGIVPLLWRQGRRTYLLIAVLQALVLILAASGLISGGH